MENRLTTSRSHKSIMTLQAQQLNKDLNYLFNVTWLNDVEVRNILAKGSEPLRDNLQMEYVKSDPTGMAGEVANYITIKSKGTKRWGTIYIGPDTKISRGWRIWWLLNYGFHHIAKSTVSGKTTITVVAGKHFVERAFDKSKQLILERVDKEFEKKLAKYAKKLGFDTKGY